MPSVEPAKLVLPDLPARVDRETGAAIITRLYFRVSPRSLERWPVGWRRVNGKAHAETAELLKVAETMLAAAPVVMGGRRPLTAQHAGSAELDRYKAFRCEPEMREFDVLPVTVQAYLREAPIAIPAHIAAKFVHALGADMALAQLKLTVEQLMARRDK